MRSPKHIALFSAVAACAAAHAAGPVPAAGPRGPVTDRPASNGAMPESQGFTEDFDGYATGSTIAGQGGWELWYSGGADARVDGTHANSVPNSLRLLNGSDVVRRVSINSGRWEFRVQTYVPSTAPPGVGGMVIMLNQYGDPAIDNWSMQLAINETNFAGSQPQPYMIESQWDRAVLPLTLDEWVEVRAEIDLDNDTWSSWYGGQPLATGLRWTDNGFASGPGIPAIACVDLWSSGTDQIWLDDVILQPLSVCYPDCDDNGVLDFFDFLCFQNAFLAGDPYADCDQNSVLDFFDFLCFQNEFLAGCP